MLKFDHRIEALHNVLASWYFKIDNINIRLYDDRQLVVYEGVDELHRYNHKIWWDFGSIFNPFFDGLAYHHKTRNLFIVSYNQKKFSSTINVFNQTEVPVNSFTVRERINKIVVSPSGRYLYMVSSLKYGVDLSIYDCEQATIVVKKSIYAICFTNNNHSLYYMNSIGFLYRHQLDNGWSSRSSFTSKPNSPLLKLSQPVKLMSISDDERLLAIVEAYTFGPCNIVIYGLEKGMPVGKVKIKPRVNYTYLSFTPNNQRLVLSYTMKNCSDPQFKKIFDAMYQEQYGALPAQQDSYQFKYSIIAYTLDDLRQSFEWSTKDELLFPFKIENDRVLCSSCGVIHYFNMPDRSSLYDRLSYQIVSDSNTFKINGVKLLQIAHESVKDFLKKYWEEAKQISREGLLTIDESISWLHLVGCLTKYKTRSEYLEAKRLIGNKFTVGKVQGHQTIVTVDSEGIVKFPDNKNSYVAIAEHLMKMTEKKPQSFNQQHKNLAKILLDRIQLKNYPEGVAESDRHFLDHLLMLMIGVESSRINLTYLTTILLLDLIQSKQTYGREQRTYSFNNMFTSGHGYQWDDQAQKDYGGKYPMAVNSTGRGNFVERCSMLYDDKNYHFALQAIVDKPQHHQIPKKEISLLIHWLQSLSEDIKQRLSQCSREPDLHDEIKKIFSQRLESAYLSDHINTVAISSNKYSYYASKAKQFQQNFDGLYYYVESLKDGDKYAHRVDIPCKLVFTHAEKLPKISLVKRTMTAIVKSFNSNNIKPLLESLACPEQAKALHFSMPIALTSFEIALLTHCCLAFIRKYGLPFLDTDKLAQCSPDQQFQIDNAIANSAKLVSSDEKQLLTWYQQMIHHSESGISFSPDLDMLEPIRADNQKHWFCKIREFCKEQYSRLWYNNELAKKIPLDSYFGNQLYYVDIREAGNLPSIRKHFEPVNFIADVNVLHHSADSIAVLVLEVFKRQRYELSKEFSSHTPKEVKVTPCPKCFAESAPSFPAMAYAHKSSVCLVNDMDSYYHRPLTVNKEAHCPRLSYDQQKTLFTCKLSDSGAPSPPKQSRLSLNLLLVIEAERQGKKTCPHCWLGYYNDGRLISPIPMKD
jgi:hypothetical protein